MPRLSRAELLLLAAAAALYLLACNGVALGHYVDDTVWVLLSRNFAHGSALAAWSYFPRLETTATWGLPLLLMPAALLFGKTALAYKAACALMTLTGLTLFYLATRERFSGYGRPAYLAGLFFNGFCLSFSGAVISEAGYLLVFGAAVYLYAARGKRLVALALLSALLVLTRVIGLAFVLALLWTLLREKRRRDALRCALIAAAAALPYFVASKLSSGALSYHGAGWDVLWQTGPAAACGIALKNAYYYLKGLALLSVVYFPVFLPNVGWIKALAVSVVAAVVGRGAADLADDENGRLLARYGLLLSLIIVAWPFQAPRFALPLFPIFWLALASGLNRAPKLLLALSLLGPLSNLGEMRGAVRASLTGPADIAHESYLWLREHSAENDLVVSMDIARVYYYSGRRGLHFIAADSPADFARKARALGAKYFLVRQAGYVPTTRVGKDPVTLQQERLVEFLTDGRLFAPIYANPSEGVRLWALRP